MTVMLYFYNLDAKYKLKALYLWINNSKGQIMISLDDCVSRIYLRWMIEWKKRQVKLYQSQYYEIWLHHIMLNNNK